MKDPTAMLAGVGLLSLCCISSSLLAGAMGGSEATEEPTTTTSTEPSFPKGQYIRLEHTVAHDANAEGNDDDKHKSLTSPSWKCLLRMVQPV